MSPEKKMLSIKLHCYLKPIYFGTMIVSSIENLRHILFYDYGASTTFFLNLNFKGHFRFCVHAHEKKTFIFYFLFIFFKQKTAYVLHLFLTM